MNLAGLNDVSMNQSGGDIC